MIWLPLLLSQLKNASRACRNSATFCFSSFAHLTLGYNLKKSHLCFPFLFSAPTLIHLQGSPRIPIYRSHSVPNGYNFVFFRQFLEKNNVAVSKLTLRTATQNSIPIVYLQLHFCGFCGFFWPKRFFPSNIYLAVCLELVSSERRLQYLSLTRLSPLVLELIVVMSRGLCCTDNSAHLCYFPCKDCKVL